jgi:hypothetical protein
LYQCFFTLPSVRCGKVCGEEARVSYSTSFCSCPFRVRCASGFVSFGVVFVYLCDFAPAVPCISHCLEPLLLGRRPRRICPTLFGLGLLGGRIDIGAFVSGCTTRRRSGAGGRPCARHLVLRQTHGLALLGVSRRWWTREGYRRLLSLSRGDGGLETGQLGRRGGGRALLWMCCDG